MPKLTKEQIQALAQAMGIATPVEIVDNAEEASTDFNPTEVVANFINERKPIFLKEFQETVLPEKIKAVAGEFGGKLNGYIRKASNNQISLAELDKLDDNEKVQLLATTLDQNKGKDTEELRKQLNETIEQHNAEVEKVKSEYEQKVSQANGQLEDYKLTEYLSTKVLPEIPLTDGDASVRVNLLKSQIKSNYHTVFGENGLELRDKENPEVPVIDKETNTMLKPKQFAEKFFNGIGIVKKDNRDEPVNGGNDPKTPTYRPASKDVESANAALSEL